MDGDQLNALEGVEFHLGTVGPPLDEYVEAIWSVKGRTYYQREAILPNGAIELMVNYGSVQRVLAVGDQCVVAEHQKYWVAGLQTGPLSIESTAESDLISIRFRPGGAAAFFPFPLEELNDQVVEAGSLFSSRIEALRNALAAAPDFATRVGIMEAWLMLQFQREHQYERELVYRAVSILRINLGSKRIGDLCEELGLSNKHLVTLFRQVVGLPPKQLARILRFDALLNHMSQKAEPDWAQMATQHHFYDQAHLIHDFRRLSGVTPVEYWARRSPDGSSLILG